MFGNNLVQIKIYNLFYGEGNNKPLTLEKIKEKIDLGITDTAAISKSLTNVEIAILKYKMGIKRTNPFTIEDSLKLYESDYQNLTSLEKQAYGRLLLKLRNYNYINSKNELGTIITYALLKKQQEATFRFENYTKQDVISMLKKNEIQLTSKSKKTLMLYYQIKPIELLSGKSKTKILRLLKILYDDEIINKQKQLK